MSSKIKFAFFGTPERAVIALDALKEKGLLPSLVVTQPDRQSGRNLAITPPPVKKWAKREGIPFIQPESPTPADFGGDFDLFIVVAYGKILKKEVLDMPRRGSLNLHASLLPRLRGSSPIESAILTDERRTGVTVMLMDALLDHGPILAQKEAVLPDWPIGSRKLSDVLLKVGGALLAETIHPWMEGKIVPVEQDHDEATYSKKIKKEDGLLDLNGDPYKNYLKFLAYEEWPRTHFFTEKNGKKTRVLISAAEYKDGAFNILRVIPEGKREMSWKDFSSYSSKASL